MSALRKCLCGIRGGSKSSGFGRVGFDVQLDFEALKYLVVFTSMKESFV